MASAPQSIQAQQQDTTSLVHDGNQTANCSSWRGATNPHANKATRGKWTSAGMPWGYWEKEILEEVTDDPPCEVNKTANHAIAVTTGSVGWYARGLT